MLQPIDLAGVQVAPPMPDVITAPSRSDQDVQQQEVHDAAPELQAALYHSQHVNKPPQSQSLDELMVCMLLT